MTTFGYRLGIVADSSSANGANRVRSERIPLDKSCKVVHVVGRHCLIQYVTRMLSAGAGGMQDAVVRRLSKRC